MKLDAKGYRYAVVNFLERPREDIGELVCIPQSWIRVRRVTEVQSIVAYPNERPSVTQRRVEDGEELSPKWVLYLAVVRRETDTYDDAKHYILEKKYGVAAEDLCTSVENMYHPLRYNASAGARGACAGASCSHLCLSVPGGRRCACPDGLTPPKRVTQELACDAVVEAERALPLACPCQNGGRCEPESDGSVRCVCAPGLLPPHCAAAASTARAAPAAILVPVLLIAVVALGAAAAWFVIRKRPFGKGVGLGSLASSQSVSFRQGSNVEFGGVGGAEPAYTLEETTRKGRDFSNPMYEAVTRAHGEPEPPLPGIYEVPDELKEKVVSAVISPSSTETRGAGKRSRALDPAADTGADTAQLVKEDREC